MPCATQFGLPGMRILQFALRRPVRIASCRTTTTRNASSTPARTTTTRRSAGGMRSAIGSAAFLRKYELHVDDDPVGYLIRAAWGSVADIAIAPLQDLLRARDRSPDECAGSGGGQLASGAAVTTK